MTRAWMAKMRSGASLRSSNSMYRSQNGCARKSRPTDSAPLSNSLTSHSQQISMPSGKGGEGCEQGVGSYHDVSNPSACELP